MGCEMSFITIKFICHNYLVFRLNNCAMKLCTETHFRTCKTNAGQAVSRFFFFKEPGRLTWEASKERWVGLGSIVLRWLSSMRFFSFLYFSKSFFIEIYFRFQNLQVYTPAATARLRGGRPPAGREGPICN